MSHVEIEVTEGVAVVTLTAEERRNSLTRPMVDELVRGFDELEADERVHAIVVTGRGSAFCAGADLSDLLGAGAGDEPAARASLLAIYEGFLRVSRCRLPTIAAVNGPAVGAGMNLALACDVRLAGESARFDTRFLQIGLHPGGGHTWMLERAVGPQAATAMVMFGEVVSGPEAERIGLAWKCVPDAELLATAIQMAAKAALAPRQVVVDVTETLKAVGSVTAHQQAVELELGPQVVSITAPAAQERLQALFTRIRKR